MLQEGLRHPPKEVASEETDPSTGSCWTLERIRATFPFLNEYTLPGIWYLLRRLKIRLRRGRPQQYSPDPAYEEKEAQLIRRMQQVGKEPEEEVLIFADEFSYHHWPLPASTWAPMSEPAPVAERAAPGEITHRLLGGVQALSGQVTYLTAAKITGPVFGRFLRLLHETYDTAKRITVVIDNWGVHKCHAVKRLLPDLPRLELLFLPTYSPWLNPIEKLWDWLKDAVLRMHTLAGDWPALQQELADFMAQFATGSPLLLHRIGLLGDGKLAQALVTDFDG